MGDVIRFPGGQLPLGLPPQPAPAPAFRKAVKPDRICWACGTGATANGERYCTRCTLAGKDSPLVPCTVDGCNTVTKRRHRGQQFFTCPAHRAGLL